MASFSISPDRMTLTLFLFFHTFFHYILSSLSFFLSFRFRVFSSFYNLIDRITTINSHVRIIHQGYRSHVSRWFCRNLKFSFSTFQSFHSSWNFIIGELLFFFFFFNENGSRLISSVLHFLSLSRWGLIECGRNEES